MDRCLVVMYNLIKYPIMKLFLVAIILGIVCAKNIFLEQEPIVKFVNNLKTTWQAGHNKYFDGKTIQEIKSLMGTL